MAGMWEEATGGGNVLAESYIHAGGLLGEISVSGGVDHAVFEAGGRLLEDSWENPKLPLDMPQAA